MSRVRTIIIILYIVWLKWVKLALYLCVTPSCQKKNMGGLLSRDHVAQPGGGGSYCDITVSLQSSFSPLSALFMPRSKRLTGSNVGSLLSMKKDLKGFHCGGLCTISSI